MLSEYLVMAVPNIVARELIWLLNASLSDQAKVGLSTSAGTPSSDLGMDKLKTGKFSNSDLAKVPLWMASMMARVYFSGHRFPVPNFPPVHPVLINQQSTWCLVILSSSILE